MAKVNLYNIQGKTLGEYELPDALFGVAAKPELVHDAIVAKRANARIILAKTKDRSEVAGTGKKPWKQKGTGRARHGSRRSPIWVGGGITFGPTLFKNFSIKINKKAKCKALAMVLSDKVANNTFVVVEDLILPEIKTKQAFAMRQSLPGAGKSSLIVADKASKDIKRAAGNLAFTAVIPVSAINVEDVVRHEYVIASKAAVEALVETYL